MPHLEPTYLRYIYDGLVKGSVHSENAADLPEGLIGLYEEAFDERRPVLERQKLLKCFAIWALLKKEVSTAFVAELLNEPEEEIQKFIATYSSWFNSPESGKYQLYHERLKVYLLQKLSEKEVQVLHEILIARLEQAIEEQKADEFERYGLEFMSAHLSVEAMLTSQGNELLGFVYSQDIWERQLKMSRGYIWTKNSLNSVMAWASKYNKGEIIECGLQMVDLHHQEQNAAPQIVALVAEGDFDSALKRIEQFGGEDKEGLQQKFILYMLCLMELTLLESKDKPFRKEGIEKLLKHLDEQLPVHHSVLNWNDFFSSYLMFQLACEWDDLGFDHLFIFKRTNYWDKEWISEMGPFTEKQFELLLQCTIVILDESKKSSALQSIANELAKQENLVQATSVMQEVILWVRQIGHGSVKSLALKNTSSALFKLGMTSQSEKLLNESLECAQMYLRESLVLGCEDDIYIKLITSIASEYYYQGLFDKTEFIMEEALVIATNSIYERSSSLLIIATEFINQGKDEVEPYLNEVLNIIDGYKSSIQRDNTTFSAMKSFCKMGKLEFAKKSSIKIDDPNKRREAQLYISDFLNEQNEIKYNSNQGPTIAAEIKKDSKKYNLEKAKSVLQEALIYLGSIIKKNHTLTEIAIELVKLVKIEEAMVCVRGIDNESAKISALRFISLELEKQGNAEEAKAALQEAFECARGISDDHRKVRALKEIFNELAEHGKIAETFIFINGIGDKSAKINALRSISRNLAEQGKIEEALKFAREISDEPIKGAALQYISGELAKQGKIEEALECVEDISSDRANNYALQSISNELAKQGRIKEAIECARDISDDYWKSGALMYISTELAKQGKMEEALEYARSIPFESDKGRALNNIASELAKYGNNEKTNLVLKEVLESARIINRNSEEGVNVNFKDSTLVLTEISFNLFKQKKQDDANLVLEEALFQSLRISPDWERNYILKDITEGLIELDQIDLAIKVSSNIKELEHETFFVELRIDIALFLFNNRNFNSALKYVKQITNDLTRMSFLISGLAMNFYTKGYTQLAGITALEIPQIEVRQEFWKDLGKRNNNNCDSLLIYSIFKNEESRSFYLKGWVESLQVKSSIKEDTLKAMPLFKEDIKSIEYLLQLYALNQLFFENLSEEKIQRFNRTLNLQWAIDIKNQLPN